MKPGARKTNIFISHVLLVILLLSCSSYAVIGGIPPHELGVLPLETITKIQHKEINERDYSTTLLNLKTTHCQPKITKKWTWLFYDDADFYYGYDPLYDFAREAASGENINVVVLRDSYGGSAEIWFVDSSHQLQLVQHLGEVNMGDPNTLSEFISFVKNTYPAERYFLSIYDHGGGWMGACLDETNDNGWLTMDDIQQALFASGGVDVICFTAPCLMGAFESVYELRDCVKLYIGSEEISGYAHWFGSIKKICNLLNEHPDITLTELGEKIIQFVEENTWYPTKLTMSAIQTNGIEIVAENLDEMCRNLCSILCDHYYDIYSIRTKAQSFYFRWIVDIHDFIYRCLQNNIDPGIENSLRKTLESLEDVIVAEAHGSEYPNAHGLTIHFPYMRMDCEKYEFYMNTSYGLDFSLNTFWDDFLRCFDYKEPYLVGEGSFQWDKVKPGARLEGYIHVTNRGVLGSKLEWKVSSWPEWGEWSFQPIEGSLESTDSERIHVVVVAPDEENINLTGEIKIVNVNNSENFAVYPVSITTTYSREKHTMLKYIQWLTSILTSLNSVSL